MVFQLLAGSSSNFLIRRLITVSSTFQLLNFDGPVLQAPVVQRLDNAIHRINHYPVDSVVCFANTCPLDSDLSGG